MPRKKETKVEDIFIVKSDELKVMMRKYNEAFPNAHPSYFNSTIEGKKKVDLSAIKNKVNDYFELTKMDFKLDDYNLYDGKKMAPELYLPYELADIYCVMAYMICNSKNLLADGKRTVTPDTALEDIFNFYEYDVEVMNGIGMLPAQVKSYIKRHPGFKDHSLITSYLSIIVERFVVLLSSVAHSNHGMSILLNKLDHLIDGLINHTDKYHHKYKPNAPLYFDKLFAETFKDIGNISQIRKSVVISGGEGEESDKINYFEKCLVEAWGKYNARLEYLRKRLKYVRKNYQRDDSSCDLLDLMKKQRERELHYEPYDFLEYFLTELRENGVVPKEDCILSRNGLNSFSLITDIAKTLNTVYAKIDTYKKLYRDEYEYPYDKDEITEYSKIFDDINPKSFTSTNNERKRKL